MFTTRSGTPVRISNWRRKVWQPAADEIRLLAWATPYVLRPTAASLMIQPGVPVSSAAAALGHDPAIFLRTHAHLYPDDLRAVDEAMDRARADATCEQRTRSGPIEVVCAGGNAGTTREVERRPPKIHLPEIVVDAIGLEPTNLLTVRPVIVQWSCGVWRVCAGQLGNFPSPYPV